MRLAITITLKPKHYCLDVVAQFNLAREEIYLLLNDTYDFSLIAELTTSHNVHFHGIISFQDVGYITKTSDVKVKNMIYNIFRKAVVCGFICLKDLTDEDVWIRYCLKDEGITNQLITIPFVNRFMNMKSQHQIDSPEKPKTILVKGKPKNSIQIEDIC